MFVFSSVSTRPYYFVVKFLSLELVGKNLIWNRVLVCDWIGCTVIFSRMLTGNIGVGY